MYKKTEYGLVLAGGGTKGSYEVGVWKALKELKINVTAIAGTSIGALNGALILQDDVKAMEELYKNIEISDVFNLNKEIDSKKDIFNIKNIVNIVKEYMSQNGFDNEKLKDTLTKYINIDKVYKSKIDLGLVTVSMDDMKALELFKAEIPKEELMDYLLASACFPVFKAQKIENKKYFDGGIYDNVPINMIVQKGYKNIIAVDVAAIGAIRKVNEKNINIKLIKCNEELGGIFEFNRERIERNIMFGYLDTMKKFNKLQGNIYYFKSKGFDKVLKKYNLKTIYGLERAGEIYEMDKCKVYEFSKFVEELQQRHKTANEKYEELTSNANIKSIMDKEFWQSLDKNLIISFLLEVFENMPTLKTGKIIQKAFDEYFDATEAIEEIVK